MMKPLAPALALALALLALGAPAQPPAPRAPAVWSMYDTDRDGYLDRGEFYAYRTAMLGGDRPGRARRFARLDFDAIDADRDGRIAEDEMLAALRSHLQHRRRHGWRP